MDLFAIELFPCSGGMAEGFRRAGITFAMAFDKDADACASYTANHGHTPIQMDVRDLVRLAQAGWRPPQPIDLLVADPPCTPWSRAGKRMGVEDERDMLVETCDLIALLRPRAYLIGNVPGLNDAPSWHIVQKYIGGLASAGYCVADYAELDAAAYGVPQHRVRPFWFGHLEGECLRWPVPTHGESRAALPGLGLQPFVTCRDALCHLPIEDLGRPVRLRWKTTDDHRPTHPSEPAKTLTRNTHSDGCLIAVTDKHPLVEADGLSTTIRGGGRGHSEPAVVLATPHPRHPISRPDEPSFTVRTNGGRASQAASMMALPGQGMRTGSADEPSATVTAKASRVGAGAAHVVGWPWDRPATTLDTKDTLAPFGRNGRDGSSQRGNPNAIVLSEKAAAILQGFPEGWVFAGKTKRSRWSQLGQAMPPGLAEPVARAIVEQMQATCVVLAKPRHKKPRAVQPPAAVVDHARSVAALPEG